MSPEKVVVQDGVYSWDCEADYAFKLYEYRRNLRMGIWMFFMLPPLIWLHVELHVFTFSLPAFLVTCPVGYLIVFITSTCILHSRCSRILHFSMTDQAIQIINGASNTLIRFRDVRWVEEDRENHRFIFRMCLTGFVVCVPAEDYGFLRDYFLSRMKAGKNST